MIMLRSCDSHRKSGAQSRNKSSEQNCLFDHSLFTRSKMMEVVYVLNNSVSLNRKLDAPRTARDEKRRATHNEGKNIFFVQ